MHPLLDGCFLKLDRADYHFAALSTAILATVRAEPDRIPGEFDHATRRFVFRAQRDSSTPLEWSAILGDVVHNLYASLDHLACALVTVNGGTVTRSIAFPIFQNRQDWRQATRKTAGMAPRAITLLERLQPYQHPNLYHPSEHPLALLYELEMQDKHRTLVLTDNAVDGTLEGLSDGVIAPPGPDVLRRGAHPKGGALAYLNDFDDQPDLQVFLRTTYRIALPPTWHVPADESLTNTLIRVRHAVRQTVHQFQAFL
jgi:hypothetical protein